jgi:uncharacterized delta-60 repeat protein
MRSTIMTVAGCALAALALAPPASAAPGAPDPSFDGDGLAVLPFGGSLSEALVQPDGKIVVAGTTPDGDYALWRLGADGSLDRGFDGDGMAELDLGGQEYVHSAALLRDGRILVTGISHASTAIARFDADGSLDETFDPGDADGAGRLVLDVDGADADPALLRPDGTVALVGSRYAAGTPADFAILGLAPDGEIDEGAFERADFGGEDYAAAAAVGPGGTITVGGSSQVPGDGHAVMAVARYGPDGKLDDSFDMDGKVTLGRGAVHGIFVQDDGGVLVLGRTGDDQAVTIIRLTARGAIDASYGDDGRATVGFESDPNVAPGLSGALSATGSLAVSGTSTDLHFAVTRLAPGGTPDARFGTGGTATVSIGDISAPFATAVQPDGKVLLAGLTAQGVRVRVAVARLLADAAAAPGPPPATPPTDARPPVLTGLRVTPARFPRGNRRPRPVSSGRATRRSPQIRFRLSEPARVRFTFRRSGAARGSFTVQAAAGANRIRFHGRLSGRRRLAPGRYRLIATPVDATGNTGTARRASFRLEASR